MLYNAYFKLDDNSNNFHSKVEDLYFYEQLVMMCRTVHKIVVYTKVKCYDLQKCLRF